MQTNAYGNYNYATQNWQPIDPKYANQFVSHKLTQTRGGSQVVESQQPMKTGFMGKLENFAQRGSEVLGMSGNAQSRWQLFGLQEPLLAEYTAKTAYGEGSKLGGWIFLSENHFGWISHTDAQNRVVKTLVPFSNISNIIPSTRVKGLTRGTYRFNPITTSGIRPDGFQVVTKDNLIYQFFGMKNIDLVFNLLNSQWQNRYATGFQSGLQQAGFTSGAYAQQPQAHTQQPQTYAQTSTMPSAGYQQPQTYTQTSTMPPQYQTTTGFAPNQNVGKMATQPFSGQTVQQETLATKDVHSYAGGHVQTYAPHQHGLVQPNVTSQTTAYQPQMSTGGATLGQTAPGQTRF